jgi:hypothetical protein
MIRRCTTNISVESSSDNLRINLYIRVHNDIHNIAFHDANAASVDTTTYSIQVNTRILTTTFAVTASGDVSELCSSFLACKLP